MSARNDGGQTLAVTTEGTAVPMPSEQTLQRFTANPGSTSFAVPETGTYLIFYHVQAQGTDPLIARVVSGGAVLPGSSSGRMGAGAYGASFVVGLTAGDSLEVQLAGGPETVTLPDGSGACLSVVRLS